MPTELSAPDQGELSAGQPYHVLDDWVVYPAILLGVVVTTLFPVFLGQRFCLPLLNVLVIFPLFVWAVRLGRQRRAVILALYWGVCVAVVMTVAGLLMPERAALAVLNSLETRTAVLAWIAQGRTTGGSAWSLPSGLGPLLVQFIAVAGLSLLTAGFVGLLIVAVTIHLTTTVAVSLGPQAVNPLLLALTAWPVWTAVRILGYTVTAAVLAEPLINSRLMTGGDDEAEETSRPGLGDWWRRSQRPLALGVGLVLLAALLQLLLSPAYAVLLRRATGLEP